MESDREYAVRLGEIGSKLDGALAYANGVARSFDSEIETAHFEQALRITSKLLFDVLRGLNRSISLTAHIQVRRNLRDDSGKQFVGNGNVGFVDCAHQLFDAAHGVAVFQLLIAECSVCADQEFHRAW